MTKAFRRTAERRNNMIRETCSLTKKRAKLAPFHLIAPLGEKLPVYLAKKLTFATPGPRWAARLNQSKEKTMSTNASKSKLCPSGFVYLVPGSIGINDKPAFSASAEEEIFVDAMIATGVATADFSNPAATLTLCEPSGCEFVMPDEGLRPNDIVYDFPTPGPMTTIRASVTTGVKTLNRGNSLSYRFPIKGRAGRDIKLEISVAAQPVGVLVDSCTWTIDGLGPDTLNLGGPLDG